MASAFHPSTTPSPAEPIRVMIVDDSIVARTVLARMLGEESDFAIVAQAGNAQAALDQLERTAVDIILLDLEMPGRSGLAALEELIARSGARVLVVSSSAAVGAEASLSALRLGAADTLLKPRAGDFSGRFAAELASRLRRIATSAVRGTPVIEPARNLPQPAPRSTARVIDCIAIGASTGGVHALAAFFAALPAHVRAPILVTQHLPAPFMPFFVAQLTEMAGRPARLAENGMALAEGEILLAPGTAHMTVARTRELLHVRLDRRPAPSGCMPSVDPMLSSVADVVGEGGVGVVLSGMGRDGAIGAAALSAVGGMVLAQDSGSSVVWGMPGAVVAAGAAQAVLPPDGIAAYLGGWAAAEGVLPWT